MSNILDKRTEIARSIRYFRKNIPRSLLKEPRFHNHRAVCSNRAYKACGINSQAALERAVVKLGRTINFI